MRQVWKYRDAMDVEREGIFLRFTDRGGTDVSYYFHRLGADGQPTTYPGGGYDLDIVSGARLKLATRVRAIPATL